MHLRNHSQRFYGTQLLEQQNNNIFQRVMTSQEKRLSRNTLGNVVNNNSNQFANYKNNVNLNIRSSKAKITFDDLQRKTSFDIFSLNKARTNDEKLSYKEKKLLLTSPDKIFEKKMKAYILFLEDQAKLHGIKLKIV